jgi:hypothetical protein
MNLPNPCRCTDTSTPVLAHRYDVGSVSSFVICLACGSTGPYADDDAAAVALWNRQMEDGDAKH